jgi:hypothetical protein
MAPGFLQVSLQRIFQLWLGRSLNHLGQSLGDLSLSGMQLLELVQVKFSEAVKICRKEFHVHLKVRLVLKVKIKMRTR